MPKIVGGKVRGWFFMWLPFSRLTAAAAVSKIITLLVGIAIAKLDDWLGYISPDSNKPREIPKKRIPIAIDTQAYKKYVGKYSLNKEKTIHVKTENGRLLATDDGSTWLELLPFSAERFFIEGDFEEYSFRMDEKGSVTHFMVYIFDVEIPCQRIE